MDLSDYASLVITLIFHPGCGILNVIGNIDSMPDHIVLDNQYKKASQAIMKGVRCGQGTAVPVYQIYKNGMPETC